MGPRFTYMIYGLSPLRNSQHPTGPEQSTVFISSRDDADELDTNGCIGLSATNACWTVQERLAGSKEEQRRPFLETKSSVLGRL